MSRKLISICALPKRSEKEFLVFVSVFFFRTELERFSCISIGSVSSFGFNYFATNANQLKLIDSVRCVLEEIERESAGHLNSSKTKVFEIFHFNLNFMGPRWKDTIVLHFENTF